MTHRNRALRLMAAALLMLSSCYFSLPSMAQDQAATDASAAAEQAPEPLSDEELEILVARIALYPDELVALISGASLFPLQIVEASRFLDKAAKDKNLKPKDTWDGSVISLLNYPEIVTMMSDDLEWTQTLGEALTYQQKDVLIAIQQLRDEAVAAGVIESDDKMTIVEENDNIVIQSTSADTVYVPQYPPQMLYEPNYQMAPISYYPDPYPNYLYPTATFFAGAVTGALWGAAMDWDNWGVWGGRWDGGDVNIDCNNCLNNINGKVNFNDVDWKNVDRSKINFDKSQFNKIDRTAMRDRVKADGSNSLRTKAADINRDRPNALPAGSGKVSDVRKSKIDNPRAKSGDLAANRPGAKNTDRASSGGNRPAAKNASSRADRPVGKPRPAAKADNRPRQPSGLGTVESGKREQVASRRGGQAMGGGQRGGGRPHARRRWAVAGGGGAWRRRRRVNGRERMMIMTTPVWSFALRSMFAAAIMLAANLASRDGCGGRRGDQPFGLCVTQRSADFRHAGSGGRCLQIGSGKRRFWRAGDAAWPRRCKAEGRRGRHGRLCQDP